MTRVVMVDKSTKYTDRKGKWQTTVCTIRLESYYMTVYKKEVLKQFITLRSLVISAQHTGSTADMR